MRLKTTVSLVVLGLALAGCNRSINSIAPAGEPQRLPAAPVDPVEQATLPEPVGNDPAAGNPNATDPANSSAPQSPALSEQNSQVAAVEPAAPAASGGKVTREGVSGAWIVASDNPNCRMILAFTKWSGGYRAATKRCNSPELASVSAWDVEGQQVKLMDGSGNVIARLYQSASERYDGTTNSGEAISFSR